MEQFGRRITAKIRTYDDELTVEGGVTLSGGVLFEIDFEVSWRDANEPSEAMLRIYGLNDTSRALCQDAVQVEIFAGYENLNGDNIESVFVGEPQVQYSILRDGDWITEFELTSALTLTQQAKYSKSYPAGTKLYEVMQDLADSLSIPMVIDGAVDGLQTLKRGFALTGNVRQCLYEAAGMFRVSFVIMYNTLFVGALNAPTIGGTPSYSGTVEALVINHNTGLLSWPTVVWQAQQVDVLDKAGKQKVDDDGVKITKTLSYKSIELECLLQPSLRLGSVIQVESDMSAVSVGDDVSEMGGITNEIINGLYTCSSVRHIGSTGDGEFTTFITASEYKSYVTEEDYL